MLIRKNIIERCTSLKIYHNFINGKWVKSNSKKTFFSINPATEQPLGKFQASNVKDINNAVDAAEESLSNWKETPAPQRAEYLYKVVDILTENKERLAKLETQEMGKIINESRGDVQEAIDIFQYMAGEGRRLEGITTPSELKHKFNATMRIPLGVVGLITPWNFPIAIPSWKIAPALICGNTIVLKPSSDTPLCAIELVKSIEKTNIPKGVINLVTGSGEEVGMPLIRHPRVHALSFTGSREVGKYVAQNAGLKKVGLELGGKNPIIVMEDANVDLAVEGIVWAAFGTTGQRCTAASRVIVHKKVKKKVETQLVNSIRRLKIGNGMSKDVNLGPLVNKEAREKVKKYVYLGEKEGGKLLCGAKEVFSKGFFYEPTLFTNVTPNMTIAQEEIFGPVAAILEAKNIDHALSLANSTKYGLSASIYTNNIYYAFKAIEKIESGMVYVNAPTIGAEVHLPFGGIKETGNGTREGGAAVEEFSTLKTIYIDYSGVLQKAQKIQ